MTHPQNIDGVLPDVIVAWPRNCDYPLWRYFIRQNRGRFNKVIIVFTETHDGEDYREFIRYAMEPDKCLILQSAPPRGDEDWRDKAIHTALNHVTSHWIWFTEQDFLITDPQTFWNKIHTESAYFQLIGIAQQGRMHPACIFVTRPLLARTRQEFGIVEGKGDHFCKFQEDIEGSRANFTLLADEEKFGYKHLNGLSHNWHLATSGKEPNYQVEDFIKYLKDCVNLPPNFEQDKRFLDHAKRIISAYSN